MRCRSVVTTVLLAQRGHLPASIKVRPSFDRLVVDGSNHRVSGLVQRALASCICHVCISTLHSDQKGQMVGICLLAIARQTEAAEVLGRHPQAPQLRHLETLTVMAADKNSTIVFALPLDIVGPLLRWFDKKGGSQGEWPSSEAADMGGVWHRPSAGGGQAWMSLPPRGGRGVEIPWDRPPVAEAGKSNDRLDATLECRLPNGGADICSGM